MKKDKEEEQEETEEKDDKPKSRFIVAKVPTEHQLIILDNKTEEQFDVISALAKIMNDVDEIKKTI